MELSNVGTELNDSQRQQFQEITGLYEKAWQDPSARERPPDLRAFLPTTPGVLRSLILQRLIEIDLEARWQHRLPIYLEDYLKRYPELGSIRRLPLELIYGEYRNRHLYGDRPSATAYRQRFPDQYPQLRQLVEDQGTLVRVDHTPVEAGPSASSPSSKASTPASPVPTLPANVLNLEGHYKLIKLIGSGSYGEVWRAEAPGKVDVAIKIIRRTLAHEDAQRELQALELIKQLRHPFLLKVHAFWCLEDRLTIVMDLADCSLRDKLKEYKRAGKDSIPPDELVLFFRQAAEALDFLHEKNIHHRDIKPDNLLLLQGYAQVADLGLARMQESQSMANATVTGSPAYMAPEIWRGKISPHSDQYSLAVSYAELRLGRTPFGSKNMASLMIQITQEQPDLGPLPLPEQEVLLRALAKTPSERFRSCAEFMAALTEVVPNSRQPATHIRVPATTVEGTLNPADSARLSERGGSATPAPSLPGSERGASVVQPPRRWGDRAVLGLGLLMTAAVLGMAVWVFWPEVQRAVASLFNLPTDTRPQQTQPDVGTFRVKPLDHCVLTRGQQKEIPLRIVREQFSQAVRLRFTDVPEHITIEPVDPSGIPGDADDGRIRVNVGPDAKLATSFITIDAQGGGKSQVAQLQLTVAYLPEHFAPVDEGGYIRDRTNRWFFRTIERRFPNEQAIRFVLIPEEGLQPKAGKQEPRSFYIMVNKVSVNDFERYVADVEGQDPALRQQLGDGVREQLNSADRKLPILEVSGQYAFQFAEWLGGRATGSLPTVAQWNKAAGLYEKRKPPWTEGPYKGVWAPDKLKIAVGPVDRKPMRVGEAQDDEGPFGCHDMGGNGLEWTRSLADDIDEGEVPPPSSARMDADRSVFLRGRPFNYEKGPVTYKELEQNAVLGTCQLKKGSRTLGLRVIIEPPLTVESR
jgi:serine/threonine protein kinase